MLLQSPSQSPEANGQCVLEATPPSFQLMLMASREARQSVEVSRVPMVSSPTRQESCLKLGAPAGLGHAQT